MSTPGNALNVTTVGAVQFNGTQFSGAILIPAYGGTGVNNGTKTINLGSPVAGDVLTSDIDGNGTWQSIPTQTDLHTARFIVSSGGTAQGANYTTIASAITAAVSAGAPQTIFIQPGVYTENLTLQPGINLAGCGSDGIISSQGVETTANVIILGTCSASFTGGATYSGIQFKTNGASAIVTSGSNLGSLNFVNCSIFASDSTGMTLNATTKLNFYSCVFRANSQILFTATATNGMDIENCVFNVSGSASSIAAGRCVINGCDLAGFFVTTSGTGAFVFNACYGGSSGSTFLTTSGTGTSEIFNSNIISGSASAISVGSGTTVNVSSCTLSSANTNAITGAGTVIYGGVIFSGGSSTVNTSSQTGLPLTIIQGGSNASSYTQSNGIITYNGTSLVNYAGPQLSSAGYMTNSSQPAFLAYLNSNVTNATGAGTAYLMGTTVALTEIFDNGNAFSPGDGAGTAAIFTMPVTGKMDLRASIGIGQATGTPTTTRVNFNTSNRVWSGCNYNIVNVNTSSGFGYFAVSIIADMDAADTCQWSVTQSGGLGDDAGITGNTATGQKTYVSGYMLPA